MQKFKNIWFIILNAYLNYFKYILKLNRSVLNWVTDSEPYWEHKHCVSNENDSAWLGLTTNRDISVWGSIPDISLRLASNSLCRWGWPWTSDSPASTSQVLRMTGMCHHTQFMYWAWNPGFICMLGKTVKLLSYIPTHEGLFSHLNYLSAQELWNILNLKQITHDIAKLFKSAMT